MLATYENKIKFKFKRLHLLKNEDEIQKAK